MHILIVVLIGLAALAGFVAIARLAGKGMADGARPFIWVWLIASIANGVYGAVQAGIPVLNEIGAFVPIFGVPAAVAWYLARRHRAAAEI